MSGRGSTDREPVAVHLSWVAYNGRSAEMAKGLGIDNWFVYGGKGIGTARRYIRQWRETGQRLKQERPDVVFVMQPPVFSLLRVALYTARTKARMAGDLHTGAFEKPKWKWANPIIMRLLRGRHAAIVTNETLAARTRAKGIRTFISHGYLEPFVAPGGEFDDADLGRRLRDGYVLVPLAWDYDEPVEAIADAARATPEITWVLTGKAPQAFKDRAPANIVFSGFVSRPDYERLREHASAVCALTIAENTMQRAGYEAIAAGTPLVTTPMSVLVDYFGESALYADPDGASIAAKARQALAEGSDLSADMIALRDEKIAKQDEPMDQIKEWIRAGR